MNNQKRAVSKNQGSREKWSNREKIEFVIVSNVSPSLNHGKVCAWKRDRERAWHCVLDTFIFDRRNHAQILKINDCR